MTYREAVRAAMSNTSAISRDEEVSRNTMEDFLDSFVANLRAVIEDEITLGEDVEEEEAVE